VHDPGAEKAKNLDDPFLDTKAQERVATLIARTAQNERNLTGTKPSDRRPSKGST
jgi:hypothetical protein